MENLNLAVLIIMILATFICLPSSCRGGKAIEITYAKELNYKARRTILLGYNRDKIFLVFVELPGELPLGTCKSL